MESNKKGLSNGIKLALLFAGIIVIGIIIVSIKSAIDLKKEYNLTQLETTQEKEKKGWWNIEEKQEERSGRINKSDVNNETKNRKCYKNVKYNVTLNKTIERNVSEATCDPKYYDIFLKIISRGWYDEINNGSVVGRYYMKDALIINKENVSLCLEVRLRFIRENLLGMNESLKENPITIIKPLLKHSSTPLRYKWYTEKDLKKDYSIELVRILPKEECENKFNEEYLLSRGVRNPEFLEKAHIEGCYKNITHTIKEIKYYNETKVKTVEVECE